MPLKNIKNSSTSAARVVAAVLRRAAFGRLETGFTLILNRKHRVETLKWSRRGGYVSTVNLYFECLKR